MASYFEWRFVVEEETSPDIWRSTNSFDTLEEAKKVAQDSTRNSRVRQFKVTIIKEDGEATTGNGSGNNESTNVSDVVPNVRFFCPSHPHRTVTALATSVNRCPDCKQEMFRGVGMKEVK